MQALDAELDPLPSVEFCPVASQASLVCDQFQLWVMGRAEISPISVCSVPRTPLDGAISSRLCCLAGCMKDKQRQQQQ